MKSIFALTVILILGSFALAQSGRRAKEIKTTAPPAELEANEPKPKPQAPQEAPPVTAEKNQDYRCTDDGSLARILDTDVANERIVPLKEVDTRAAVTEKPKPAYTKEGRRNGIQGFVTLKVLLSANQRISRIRVVKGLPAGLTENAIRAACKIEFRPAMKDGQPVSQWIIAEYVFRLADSSIFGP
jgi:TonB family protein